MTLLILDAEAGPVMAIAEMIVAPTGKTTAEVTFNLRRVWRIGKEPWLFARPE